MRALTGLGSPYCRTHARLHSRVRACNVVYCTHALSLASPSRPDAASAGGAADGRRQAAVAAEHGGGHSWASTLGRAGPQTRAPFTVESRR